MLDAVRRDKPISIKDLVVSNPIKEAKLPFDPKTDLTEPDWRGMEQFFVSMRVSSAWSYCDQLILVKNLNPAKLAKFPINDQWAEMLKQDLDDNLNVSPTQRNVRTNWFRHSSIATGICLLYPERVDEIDLGERVFKGIREEWLSLKPWPIGIGTSNLLLLDKLMILFSGNSPIQFNPHTYISVRDKEAMFGSLNDHQWKGNREFAEYASCLKILFPDDSDKLLLNEQTWSKMRAEFNQVKAGNIFLGLGIAQRMSILAAEKVDISKEGIQLGENSKFQNENPVLPEIRRF